MAATDIVICNLALGNMGVTQPVVDITVTPTTKEEKAFQRLYAHTRRTLLARHAWNFAHRRAVLAPVNPSSLVTLDGWGYAYTLPTDCLKPRHLYTAGRRVEATDQKSPFELIMRDDATVRVLVCDLEPITVVGYEAPVLHYTMDVTNPILFPNYFDNALAWALADALLIPLRVDAATATKVEQRSRYEIMTSLADSNSEEQPDAPPDAEHIRARL